MSHRREISHALASAFLAEGDWTGEGLAARATGIVRPRPPWLGRVVRSVLAAYPRPPRDRLRELMAYVELEMPRRMPGRHVVRWRDFEPAMARIRWPVPELASPGALAAWLGLEVGELLWLADARGLERRGDPRFRHYTYAALPRPSGPPRIIERPKPRLKTVQRRILHEILDHIPAHDAAHGFVRGRSAATHAARHVGQPVLLRMDLEDFFASVAAGRVYGIFRSAGYPEAVAHALTALTTNVAPHEAFEGGSPRDWRLRRRLATPHLPQGAPTSPALASLAAFGLDVRLRALHASYSRYADDLVFSGAALPVATLRRAVTEIARDEGFRMAEGKTRVRRASQRQLVAGVVVNAGLNVPRAEYDRVKAALHQAAGGAVPSDAPQRDVVRGRIARVASLHPERGAKLLARYAEIPWSA